jgi:hypothetical protein
MDGTNDGRIWNTSRSRGTRAYWLGCLAAITGCEKAGSCSSGYRHDCSLFIAENEEIDKTKTTTDGSWPFAEQKAKENIDSR